MRFADGELRDFVIVRSDGSPMYLLAAASTTSDGHTHVIRGEDLLPSAPRSCAVRALGGTGAAATRTCR